MRTALVLGNREQRSLPGIGPHACCVIERQAGIVADFRPTAALGGIGVIQLPVFACKVALSKYRRAAREHRNAERRNAHT